MQQEPGALGNALSNIMGIEPPPAPPATGEAWLIGVVVLAVLTLVAYLAWRRYSSPRARARRNLKDLQRRFQQQEIDGRRATFELAAIVRDTFGVSHLSNHFPSLRRTPTGMWAVERRRKPKPRPQSSEHKEMDSDIRPRDEHIETRWRDFMQQLATARYAAPELSPGQVGELFNAARQWLRRRP